MENNNTNKSVFQTTFLFGFVQVLNIIVKVGINKISALFLGAEGLGMVSLFQTTITTIKTGAGLGLDQSAVRDISEAYGYGDEERYSETISIVKKIIWLSTGLGIITMILLSSILSRYSFGNTSYTLAYIFLSIAVGANILNDGLKTIITGTRRLKSLAKMTMLGSCVGIITAAPFYYFLGEDGIVPSLICSSIAMVLITLYFLKQVRYKYSKISYKKALKKSFLMIKMGIALMFKSFLLTFVSLILSSYITNNGGLEILGYYQSGLTIINSYFGIIFTAMSTDYYPRISAINKDNSKLNIALNSQSEIGLIIAFPLVVFFSLFSPFFLEYLYTSDFIIASEFCDYAILGAIIIVCSNCLGMIFMAKQAVKIFLSTSIIVNAVTLPLYILLYEQFALTGLGIGYFVSALIQLIVNSIILKIKFSINLNKSVLLKLLFIITFCILTIFVRKMDETIIKYVLSISILVFTIVYTLLYMRKEMNIDFISYTRKIFKNKK